MNILFLTIIDFESLEEKNLYTDLLREFKKNGHALYIISPVERKKKIHTQLLDVDGVKILKLKIGNFQKTNFIEKGITTCLLESQFLKGIKKYFPDVRFDLILYSTPPITFIKTLRFLRNRDGAYTYLMLKDIFPQNAVDLGVLKTQGITKWLYRYFRKKEKNLYAYSNKIGCMSQANINYMHNFNPFVNRNKLEICPNSIEPETMKVIGYQEICEIRKHYGIPIDKVVFIYGGNLGEPQGIPFLMQCIEANEKEMDSFLLIVGDGTGYLKLNKYFQERLPYNAKLIKFLPSDQYKELVKASDVGLIFLDYRFTIPNFPSRLLSYLECGMPVLASTDKNTDIGKVIEDGGFGKWCSSDSVEDFIRCERELLNKELRDQYGFFARKYLEENYSVEISYQTIINAVGRKSCLKTKRY